MRTLDTTDPTQLGIAGLDKRHFALFDRVLEAYHGRRFVFVLDDRNLNGMKVFRDHVKVWLTPSDASAPYSFAHECAHLLSNIEHNALSMRPDRPREGSRERRLLAELLSLFDHPLAHGLLHDAGFEADLAAEAVTRRRFFLEKDIPTANWSDPAVRYMMAMGYANMVVTFVTEDVPLGEIESAMQTKAPQTLMVGKIFAAEVTKVLNGSVDGRIAAAVSCAKAFINDPAQFIVPFDRMFN